VDAAAPVPVRGMSSTMSHPLIGVTGMWSNRVHGLRRDGNAVSARVLQSIARAGGEPLALFAESAMDPRERVRRLDGIVIPGGADVRPELYGQAEGEHTRTADYPVQDDFEKEIILAAISENVPMLAICRGFQLLNVAAGGTLVQDLAPGSIDHRDAFHEVDIEDGSTLERAVGSRRITVSSYHHQAIDRVGAGLSASAVAPDGVVEALEHPTAPVLAVQWHPEDDADVNPAQQALFAWLTRSAGDRRNSGENALAQRR